MYRVWSSSFSVDVTSSAACAEVPTASSTRAVSYSTTSPMHILVLQPFSCQTPSGCFLFCHPNGSSCLYLTPTWASRSGCCRVVFHERPCKSSQPALPVFCGSCLLVLLSFLLSFSLYFSYPSSFSLPLFPVLLFSVPLLFTSSFLLCSVTPAVLTPFLLFHCSSLRRAPLVTPPRQLGRLSSSGGFSSASSSCSVTVS